MKREMYSGKKMLGLASRLNGNVPFAIGIVLLMADFVDRFTPNGRIGKYESHEIASYCTWSSDPDLFINILVESGWLEFDDTGTLVVSEWSRVKNLVRGSGETTESRLARRRRRKDRLKQAGGNVTRELRLRVYLSAGNRCQRCGATENLAVDHIKPISKGGLTVEDNLQCLCRSCNSWKGDREVRYG